MHGTNLAKASFGRVDFWEEATRNSARGAAAIAVLVLAFGLPVGSASALGVINPGVYQLLDHGNGNLGPAYGLRVDAINEVFSVTLGSAFVTLTWDGGTTATIAGTLNQNTLGGNGGVGPAWQILYTLTGVSAVGTAGFTATGGSGTLTDPFSNVTSLTGEADDSGSVFSFLADGYRVNGDNDSAVGRGWLLPPNSTDDWLVRAVSIPEPGTGLLLIGFGLAWGHRRTVA